MQEKANPFGPISQDPEVEPMVTEVPCESVENIKALLKELPDLQTIGMLSSCLFCLFPCFNQEDQFWEMNFLGFCYASCFPSLANFNGKFPFLSVLSYFQLCIYETARIYRAVSTSSFLFLSYVFMKLQRFVEILLDVKYQFMLD